MSKLFGANWQTTLWGGIFALSTAIATSPALVEFLPDAIEGWVRGLAGVIVAVSGLKFAKEAKSKDVTGGVVQQTASGAPAAKGTQDMVDLTVKATEESGEKVPDNLKTPPPN